MRARAVESALQGVELGEAVRQACEEAAEGTSPTSDLHAQADYRRHLAQVLTHRAVNAAAGRP
ncbi:hypothetical protein GCM10018965_062620 [Nonomuraea roseola]